MSTRCGRRPAASRRRASTAVRRSRGDRRRRLIALGAAAAAAALLHALVRELDAVVVRGRSMAPAILPGDRLLVARLRRSPRLGEVVLARDPRAPHRELIKRVGGVEAGEVVLRGDDPESSTDARVFGTVPASEVRWRVLLRYWPASRVGAVPSPTSTGSAPEAHALSGRPSRQP